MTQLRVFHLPGEWGLPSVSPFCLRLDAFLQMTGIEHEAITASTPFPGPKKKAPWIEFGDRKLGDSSIIIAFLKREFGVDPDAHLPDEQRGIAIAIQRLVEEHLYWAMVYDRWCRDDNWPILKGTVLGGIPAPVRAIIAPRARSGVRKQLAGHGMGLHSEEEIEAIARDDLAALASILGERSFVFGDKPSMADAAIYSVLANIRYVGFSSPMKAMIEGHTNLAAMIDRFRDAVYPTSTARAI
jgi:glutathione S-transferase